MPASPLIPLQLATLLALLIGPGCASRREDEVFRASDELHWIALYQPGDFAMLHNGFNTVAGTYQLRHDTIRLRYDAQTLVGDGVAANDRLPRLLRIDRRRNHVSSIDNRPGIAPFCAYFGPPAP